LTETGVSSVPLTDLREEAVRVLDAAAETGVVLRSVGGLAVFLRCPSARRPPLARTYADLDLVGRRGDARPISDLLSSLGYSADEEFNKVHGHQRLYFVDRANGRHLDVFVERMVLCHELDLEGRLDLDPRSVTLADLLLSKLQVVEVNERDLKDATALLADHPLGPGGIDVRRITDLLASDWGWWRTATTTLGAVARFAGSLDGFDGIEVVRERAAELLARIDAAPKAFRWRLRAKIGERVRWYELPEEIEA
jgi:hypothetical protein